MSDGVNAHIGDGGSAGIKDFGRGFIVKIRGGKKPPKDMPPGAAVVGSRG